MNNSSVVNMNGHANTEEQVFGNNTATSNGSNGTNSNSNNGNRKPASSSNQKSELRAGRRHDPRYLDVIRERPIRVTVKVLVPVKEHPKFNFVGKLLGPKGNSMKRLQEETMTKMAVLGRGSMRDRAKEEELRASGDPKYLHLSEELHVEITSFAAPAEAHARIAYALAEVRRYLVPDNNDDIRKEQIREMELISDNNDKPGEPREGRGTTNSPSPSPSITGGNNDRPNAPLTPPADHLSPESSSECRIPPIVHLRGGRGHPPPHSRLLPLPRALPPLLRKLPPPSLPPPPPAKRRVLSILDKAKMALDQSYGIQDDHYDHHDYMYEDYPDYGHEEYSEVYPREPYDSDLK